MKHLKLERKLPSPLPLAPFCIGVALVTAWPSFSQETESESSSAVSAPSAETQPAAPTADEPQTTSAPQREPAQVSPPPKQKIYFLLQRVEAPVEGGIKGFAPGTRLRLLDDSGLKWRLTDGTNLVEVEPALLTRDEETAKAMLISDQKAREAALAARTQALKEAEAKTLAERERHSKAVQDAAIPEKAGLTGESRLLKPSK